MPPRAIQFTGRHVERLSGERAQDAVAATRASYQFAGVEDHYFLNAALPAPRRFRSTTCR